jgi:SH3-like domain-containing protein
VLHTLLSGRRTALVAPGKKGQAFKIYTRPKASADVAATLQSGVIANVRNCDGSWCLIDGEGFKGYIEQVALWGVYPDEKVE